MTTKEKSAIETALPYIFMALAGGRSVPFCSDEARYIFCEKLKREATDNFSLPSHALGTYYSPYRMVLFLCHAYAHWLRAENAMDTAWDASHYEEVFPYGFDFRKYLSAWLWAVGIPKLNMLPEDCQAFQDALSIGACPHILLPKGRSCMVNEEVESAETH